jgi:RiboL-PSP-HEPN
MSRSRTTFQSSIKDAEELLDHFDSINKKPPPDNAEVLKRAGLIMALTAWETYVEDRITEEMEINLKVVSGSYLGDFVQARLKEELKRFHNPTSEKTRRIFLEYVGIDVTTRWEWQNFDPPKARKTLDELIAKRGDAVHRSKPAITGVPAPHSIKREELDRAIKFLKHLVEANDQALEK